MSSTPELPPEIPPVVEPVIAPPNKKGHVCRPYLFCRRCWGTSFAVHLVLLTAILLFVPGASQPSEFEIPPFRTTMADGGPLAVYEDEDELMEETLEETEEVFDQEIVAEEPVIKDEEIADHVER